MKLKAFIIFAFIIIFSTAAYSQADREVSKYLQKVAQGDISEVKMKLPDLLAEYPDHPGVMLLHGAVIEDAFRALDIYKKIVDEYDDSQWADDAYWRIIQFYAIQGDTTRAQINYMKLKQNYPASEFLGPASDVVRSSIALARSSKEKKSFTASSTASTTASTQAKVETKPAYREKTEPEEKLVDHSAKPPETPGTAQQETMTELQEKDPQLNKKQTPQTEETADVEAEITGDGRKYYGLQVGIYSTRERAEKEKEKYQARRMRTEVLQKNVDGQSLYAVVIGNYSSRESAETTKVLVKQFCQCEPIIIEK